jgi:hypothetical protein
MKNNINPSFTISVEKDSNLLIGSSDEKFAGIRDGSLIKIDEDSFLYTVIGKNNWLYIEDFTLSDSKTIKIDKNIGVNLQKGDNIKISFKEFELVMIENILDKGDSFTEGDELYLESGEVNVDIKTGRGEPTILKIDSLEENNGIKRLSIIDKGKYITPPQNPVKVTNNNGQSALLNLNFQENTNRAIVERTITNIHYQENQTLLSLNYSLPPNLKEGKLSCEKNALKITPNYLGSTNSNLPFKIYKDFTPYLNIPLTSKNSLSPELIFNKAMHKIDERFSQNDKEIKELKEIIRKLENK